MSAPVADLKKVMDVSGLNVIVTGGSGGIGGGISEAFAQRGANVAIFDINVEDGQAEAVKLRQSGGEHIYLECDVTDRGSVRDAVQSTIAAFGHIDVLVNNAGISRVRAFLDMDDDLPEWREVVDVNLGGTVNVTHAVANRMRAAKRGGLIINISSIGGVTCSGSKAMPQAGYVASKAAINHLSRSWAIEFAEYDIRVNCIMPGPTHSRLDAQLTPGMKDSISHGMLTRRFGEPLEIGALCVFFASAEGAQLNGVVMPHDGGFLCVH